MSSMTMLRIRASLGALLLGAAGQAALAEDIDVFAAQNPQSDLPNVVIALDTSANANASSAAANCTYVDGGGPTGKDVGTKFAQQQCALYNVISSLPVASDGSALVNVGLMMFNEPNSSTKNGAYPRTALLPMTATNKTYLKNVIKCLYIGGNSWPQPDCVTLFPGAPGTSDGGNNADISLMLYEAFLWVSAQKPWFGMGTANKNAGSGAFTTWPYSASSTYYRSTAASGCARNYIILIANGDPNNTGGGNTAAEATINVTLSAPPINADMTPINYPKGQLSNKGDASYADETARYIRNKDISSQPGAQTAVVHAVAVTGNSNDKNYPELYKNVAYQGGGQYYQASDAASLQTALGNLFNDIIALNSIFSSASLPVSINSRGTYNNQIFMGLFRPDAQARPRWNGNIKQYQFAYNPVSDFLQLVDSTGAAAVSSSSGFISTSAISYWTTSSKSADTPNGFWVNSPSGQPQSADDSPDGEVVEKGGAAEVWRKKWLKGQSLRNVYTCISCSSGTTLGTGATVFNSSNGSVVSSVGSAAIVDWVRGADNKSPTDEYGPGSPVTVRPSLHGDVLHSRPVAIDYGKSAGNQVVVYYGANDGMLHAIQGQQGAGGGEELWAFVAPEHFSTLKRIYNNSPEIKFPSTPATISPTPTPRDYFMDGPIGSYQQYDSSGNLTKAWIYVTMRRGGRTMYAFDVTDYNKPKFMWKRSFSDSNFAALGYTWSQPKVAKVLGRSSPVIIMGGGYDPAEDASSPPSAVTMGNAVFVIDAFDGSRVAQFGGSGSTNGASSVIARAVPADVTLVDSDFDGYVDRAYAVDLGGTIYRIDFEVGSDTSADKWTITPFATTGSSIGTKFFYPPDAIVTKNFTAVVGGTGDREKPLDTKTNENFFLVLDRVAKGASPAANAWPIDLSGLPAFSDFSLSSSKGCKLPLDPNGEKVVNAPITIGGTTYFATNTPAKASGTSCTNYGTANSYAVPLFCQAPTIKPINGGGLPPSPVAGVVNVTYTDNNGKSITKQVPFIIGGQNTKNSAIEGTRVKLPITPKRSRLYWYYEADR